MPWESDGLTYEYNPPAKLDMVKDNFKFLENESGVGRAKFIRDYFYYKSLEEPVYIVNSFGEGAFLQTFDMVKRKGQLEGLCFRKANPDNYPIGGYWPPTTRDIDLARFRLYDERIEDLENRLKTLENALIDVSNKIFTNWHTGLFDTSGGDANDSAEA